MNFMALHLDELIRHHVNPKQEICSKMQVEAIAKELDVTPLQLLLILTTAALNIEAFIERLQEENRLLKIKLSLFAVFVILHLLLSMVILEKLIRQI